MTPDELEKETESDAAALALVLLLSRNKGRVTFRADVGRFYVDGRSVSIKTIRSYLMRVEKRQGERIGRLMDDLAKGRISLAAWQREFELIVTTSHTIAGALAIGSLAAAVRSETVKGRIDSELRYADKFAVEIREGKAGSAAQQKARAKSYLMATAITYGVLELESRGLMSIYTEARRIRRASESCDGCRRLAGKWMPIAELKPIGSMECGSRCRCYLEYR